jgi:hypothetical protein
MLWEWLKLPKTRELVVQFAHAARVARRRHAEQCVATRSEPVIKNRAEFCKRPDVHDWRKPSPTREHANHIDPSEITFCPPAVGRSYMHLFGHGFARVWCRALEDFRIVVVKPFQSLIAIKWLNVLSHPATKIALAISVNFDFSFGVHKSANWLRGSAKIPRPVRKARNF